MDELVIDSAYRGMGFGKLILESISKIAHDETCKRIELDSAFHRVEAHKFYEFMGFENRAYLFSKQIQ